MNNFRLMLFLPIIAFLVNSCSSTHDFAGAYPKNNITGTGIGGHAAYNDVTNSKQNITPVAETASLAAVVGPASTDAATLTAQLTTNGKKLTRGEKFGIKLDAFLLKKSGINDLSQFSATDYMSQHKDVFSLRQKLADKLYSKLYAKYAAHHSAADVAGISGPLGIVSLVFGILALIGYYGSFAFAVIAIVTGSLSLVGGARRPIMAILGIIFGVIAIVSWAAILATVHVIIVR